MVAFGLSLVCAVGCRRGSSPREPRGAAQAGEGFELPMVAPEVEESVQIRAGTRLFQAPDAKAPSVVAKFVDGQSRAAEVAEVKGEWIGVWLSPVDDVAYRCNRTLSEMPLQVQVWVRAEELPIVAKLRTSVEFADLSSVIVMTGVVVRATGERGPRGRLFEIDAEGTKLVLPLPEDRLGRSYFPTPEVEPIEVDAPRPVVRVGDQVVHGDVSVSLAPIAPTEKGRLAEVRSSCLDMVAWGAEEQERPQQRSPRQANSGFDRGEHPEERQLGENVELRWFDGSPAGVTTGSVQARGGRFGERFCFDVLDGETDPPLVLCAAG